jgi:hypothetical protein
MNFPCHRTIRDTNHLSPYFVIMAQGTKNINCSDGQATKSLKLNGIGLWKLVMQGMPHKIKRAWCMWSIPYPLCEAFREYISHLRLQWPFHLPSVRSAWVHCKETHYYRIISTGPIWCPESILHVQLQELHTLAHKSFWYWDRCQVLNHQWYPSYVFQRVRLQLFLELAWIGKMWSAFHFQSLGQALHTHHWNHIIQVSYAQRNSLISQIPNTHLKSD